ncbi:MAG: DUF4870 domain-containing protein [Chitinophagales bacterium]|nr:DUF4870 domain-containing protein [Chitinophagales bacterium]
MSIVAILVGMPLPVINLAATLLFFLGNRKATFYVRWHCVQALLSQLSVFIVNTMGISWTMTVILTDAEANNYYVAYMIIMVLYNTLEFIATLYAAIRVRKGKHVEFFLYGPLTHLIIKEPNGEDTVTSAY